MFFILEFCFILFQDWCLCSRYWKTLWNYIIRKSKFSFPHNVANLFINYTIIVNVICCRINPFQPADVCILTHLQQTTFENIVAKGEIAHDEQFFLCPQCFILYLTIKLSFMEIFQVFVIYAFKVVCYKFVVCGKGLLTWTKCYVTSRLTPREFNSYGSRRGNDAVMSRGTFANIRLINKFTAKPGPRTIHLPSGEEVSCSLSLT